MFPRRFWLERIQRAWKRRRVHTRRFGENAVRFVGLDDLLRELEVR